MPKKGSKRIVRVKRGKRASESRGFGTNGVNISRSLDFDQRIVKESFRLFSTGASSTAADTVIISETDYNPTNFGGRGIAFADLYQFYRIVEFQAVMHFHPGINTTATTVLNYSGMTLWGMGVFYAPKSTYTAPTTSTEFVDLPHVVIGSDSGGTLTCRLNRNDLLKHMPQKWCRTASTGVDDTLYTQFCFLVYNRTTYAMAGGANARIVIDMVVEFSGSVDPVDIPKRFAARKRELELKTQSVSPPSPGLEGWCPSNLDISEPIENKQMSTNPSDIVGTASVGRATVIKTQPEGSVFARYLPTVKKK